MTDTAAAVNDDSPAEPTRTTNQRSCTQSDSAHLVMNIDIISVFNERMPVG